MRPRDPRNRATARRPLLPQGKGRRALTNVGGEVEATGDPMLARVAAEALLVRAGERDATLTHPFHAYPARLHPEVARRLVAHVTAAGSPRTILDPCCGSGTVVVEALVAGHRAIGTDLSPLAVELTRIKTRRTTNAERKALIEAAHRVAREARELMHAGRRGAVPVGEVTWFEPHILGEVAILTSVINAQPPGFVRDALRMLLSSILVKVSRQASDSDTRQVTKDLPPGTAFRHFARKSFELAKGLATLAAALPQGAPAPDVHADDATRLDSIAPGTVDAVITSPPYANTYDYVAHHERRYAWLGLDPGGLARSEMGAARWFKDPSAGTARFDQELAAFCAALDRALTAEGSAWLIIGDGAAAGQPLDARSAVRSAIAGKRLTLAAVASQARPAFDADSGAAFARTPRREHLIVLTRP